MIAPNEKKPEKPVEFTPHEVYKLCFILLHKAGKVELPKEVFDNFPKDATMDCTFDKKTKYWTFTAPMPKSMRKRKPSILTPSKRLFIPR